MNDMFNKIMPLGQLTELRAWGILLFEKLDLESRSTSEEQECAAQDVMLWIMRDQLDVRHLVELQEKQLAARFPRQPLQNGWET